MFDAAIRPSFVARLRLSPRLGRIFFKKQTSNQLNAQLVIAIYEPNTTGLYFINQHIMVKAVKQGYPHSKEKGPKLDAKNKGQK